MIGVNGRVDASSSHSNREGELRWRAVELWVGIASLVFVAVLAWHSSDVASALIVVLMIAGVVRSNAVRSKRAKEVSVRALAGRSYGPTMLAIDIVCLAACLVWGGWLYMRGAVAPLSFAALMINLASPFSIVADGCRDRRVAREIESLDHLDIKVPIQTFEGSRFAIREVTLRFDREPGLVELVKRLAPAMRFYTISIEEIFAGYPFARAVAAPVAGPGFLRAQLHRAGILVDDESDRAFEDGAILFAHV